LSSKYYANFDTTEGENKGDQYIAVSSWGVRYSLNFKSVMKGKFGIGPSFLNIEN
jgi:hypothetical protein